MSMTQTDLESALRMRIGNPDPNDVPDRHLQDFLLRGLEWLAAELEYAVTTSSAAVTLVAATQEYTVPTDLSQILWVEWNSGRLTPNSMFAWDRDNPNWRQTPAGTPREYALFGRQLIFYPAPNAAAVALSSAPTLRYFSATPGLTASGAATAQLGDDEQMLAVYHAAMEYLGLHPQVDPGGRMAATNAKMLSMVLPAAKTNRLNALVEFNPRVSVEVRRAGAAR